MTAPAVIREALRTFQVSLAEMKLLLRLRQIGRRSVVMLQLDDRGTIVALTVLDSKTEKL